MFSVRTSAIAVGVFFLITHVTSVLAAFVFYAPVLTDPDFVLGAGPADGVRFGGLLDVVLALAIVGTSVAIYPVAKRASEGFALGYVALRTLEAGVILVGVVLLMSVVALIGSGSTDLARSLVSGYELTFIIGPGLICPVNTIVLAVLLYRTGLVPRFIPILGFVGAPLVFAVNVTKLFGVFDQLPTWVGIGVVPLFAWELSLAIYLISRGFRPAALARLATS